MEPLRSCRRLIRKPDLRASQSSLGVTLHDSLRKALCRRSLVLSHESRTCETESTRADGSLDPDAEKSSCATPRPVRMASRSVLMALRS